MLKGLLWAFSSACGTAEICQVCPEVVGQGCFGYLQDMIQEICPSESHASKQLTLDFYFKKKNLSASPAAEKPAAKFFIFWVVS